MERQYIDVPFEIKAEDISEDGTFIGYASTFGGSPDSHGDVIRKGAFKKTIIAGGRNKNGIAMLWQHDTHNPIGVWAELVENNTGLKVRGQLEVGSEFGKRVYNLMKMGALKGLSIGWDFARDAKGDRLVGSFEYDEKKNIRYLNEVVLWEISPVTFASNRRASITGVKAAIENASNERELETALRDECNLSSSSSKYIVSLCKDKLFHRDDVNKIEVQKRVDEAMSVLKNASKLCLLEDIEKK